MYVLNLFWYFQVSKFQQQEEVSTNQTTILEQQNENLRAIIRQMRQEMENLGDSVPGSARATKGTINSKGLVANGV